MDKRVDVKNSVLNSYDNSYRNGKKLRKRRNNIPKLILNLPFTFFVISGKYSKFIKKYTYDEPDKNLNNDSYSRIYDYEKYLNKPIWNKSLKRTNSTESERQRKPKEFSRSSRFLKRQMKECQVVLYRLSYENLHVKLSKETLEFIYSKKINSDEESTNRKSIQKPQESLNEQTNNKIEGIIKEIENKIEEEIEHMNENEIKQKNVQETDEMKYIVLSDCDEDNQTHDESNRNESLSTNIFYTNQKSLESIKHDFRNIKYEQFINMTKESQKIRMIAKLTEKPNGINLNQLNRFETKIHSVTTTEVIYID